MKGRGDESKRTTRRSTIGLKVTSPTIVAGLRTFMHPREKQRRVCVLTAEVHGMLLLLLLLLLLLRDAKL